MKSLPYYCIPGLADIKTYAQKMQDAQVTKSLHSGMWEGGGLIFSVLLKRENTLHLSGAVKNILPLKARKYIECVSRMDQLSTKTRVFLFAKTTASNTERQTKPVNRFMVAAILTFANSTNFADESKFRYRKQNIFLI